MNKLRMSSLPILVSLALATGILNGEEEKVEVTTLVSTSPDGKIEIVTAEPLPLWQEGSSRAVGRRDEEPYVVAFVNTIDRRLLGEVNSEVGGPVSAAWRADSRYVILSWAGYRYKWAKYLVYIGDDGIPQVVEFPYKELTEVLRHDTRTSEEKGEAEKATELNYPFEKRRWFFSPSQFTNQGLLRIGVIEYARLSYLSHPFDQGAVNGEIEVELDGTQMKPVRMFDRNVEWKAPEWKMLRTTFVLPQNE